MSRVRSGEKEYFHIFNRGVEKRIIYLSDEDRWRFVTLLILFQSGTNFPQVGRLVSSVKHRMFDRGVFEGARKGRCVELVSFCLMPNHFHLLLRELKSGGISKFMQRLLNAYAKYFNTRHHRSGHLFGGKFKSVHISRNEYLNYLSAYIHLNPRELKHWSGKEIEYPWSSFQDFALENRWGSFLNPSIVLGQFGSKKEYRSFVEETPVKKIENRIEDKYLMD